MTQQYMALVLKYVACLFFLAIVFLVRCVFDARFLSTLSFWAFVFKYFVFVLALVFKYVVFSALVVMDWESP